MGDAAGVGQLHVHQVAARQSGESEVACEGLIVHHTHIARRTNVSALDLAHPPASDYAHANADEVPVREHNRRRKARQKTAAPGRPGLRPPTTQWPPGALPSTTTPRPIATARRLPWIRGTRRQGREEDIRQKAIVEEWRTIITAGSGNIRRVVIRGGGDQSLHHQMRTEETTRGTLGTIIIVIQSLSTRQRLEAGGVQRTVGAAHRHHATRDHGGAAAKVCGATPPSALRGSDL